MELRKCYLCGSESAPIIHKGTRGGHDEIDVLRCDECGLVRLSESIDEVDEFYSKSGMRDNRIESIEKARKLTRTDDKRRFIMTEKLLDDKSVLDFGCGDGGYLIRAKSIAKQVAGIEMEDAMRESLVAEGVECHKSLSEVGKFDVITMFHVLEHLVDPILYLAELKSHLKQGGKLVIETPNSEDALLSLYGCEAFADFTYWNCHVYLYNTATLSLLAKKVGWKVLYSSQVQRYSLANHLYWLAKHKPAGHIQWNFMEDSDVDGSYGKLLARLGIADTLFTVWEMY